MSQRCHLQPASPDSPFPPPLPSAPPHPPKKHPPSVYDVTRADSFENLERIWMKEVDIYSNIEDAVKMVVANKVDLVSVACLGFAGSSVQAGPNATRRWAQGGPHASCQHTCLTFSMACRPALRPWLLPCKCALTPPLPPLLLLLRVCVTHQESERQVSTTQGHDFARRMGCLYVETSAKTNVAGGSQQQGHTGCFKHSRQQCFPCRQ
jgi:hypothetical protein